MDERDFDDDPTQITDMGERLREHMLAQAHSQERSRDLVRAMHSIDVEPNANSAERDQDTTAKVALPLGVQRNRVFSGARGTGTGLRGKTVMQVRVPDVIPAVKPQQRRWIGP